MLHAPNPQTPNHTPTEESKKAIEGERFIFSRIVAYGHLFINTFGGLQK